MDWELISRVLLPESFLLIGILVTLLMSIVEPLKKFTPYVAALFLALAALNCLPNISNEGTQVIFYGSFVQDGLSVFFRLLIYAVTLLIVLGSSQYLKVLESSSEYYPIMLTAALGAGMLTGANDLLLLFVSLETLGLSAILLASYARLNRSSNEAGIKYLINSAAATAILLMGISFTYGLTGFTNFVNIAERIKHLAYADLVSAPLLILISACLVGALAFKFAAAPFHNWSPDVYSGAPTTTTVFLSVVSKAAAFAVAIRLFHYAFRVDIVPILFTAVAILSIIIGNYVGMIQMISRGSLKRLLAYSSIAQAGYLIVGLAVFDEASISAMILYLAIYAVMNTGAFLAAIYFEQITESERIYDYAGMIKKRPAMTIAFALCLINLAGLPFIPAGFIAKFFLFSAAFTSTMAFGKLLAIVGLLGSIIALYYYVYMIKVMVVDTASTKVQYLAEHDEEPAYMLNLSTGFAVLLMTGFGIFGMDFLKELSGNVVGSLFG